MLGAFRHHWQGASAGSPFLKLAMLVLAAIACIWWSLDRADHVLREELLLQAHLASHAINLDHLSALVAAGEASSELAEFEQLQRQLIALRDTDRRYHHVYLLGSAPGGGVHLLAHAPEADDPSGDTLPDERFGAASPALRGMFVSGHDIVEGPSRDDGGVWVSALVPLAEPGTGRVMAVLGVDVDAGVWRWNVLARSILPMALFLLILIAAGAVLIADRVPGAAARPVTRRLLLPLTFMMAALIGGAGVALKHQHRQMLDRKLEAVTDGTARELASDLQMAAAGLAMTLQPLTVDERLVDAMRRDDHADLTAHLVPWYTSFADDEHAAHLGVMDAAGSCLYCCHGGAQPGDRVDRPLVLASLSAGKTAYGPELSPTGELVLRAVQPVRFDDEVLGLLDLSQNMDGLLHAMHTRNRVHLTVLAHKHRVDRESWTEVQLAQGREADWDRLRHSVVVYTSLDRLPDVLTVAADHDHTSDQPHGDDRRVYHFGSRTWRVAARPFVDGAGADLGCLLILCDITDEQAAFDRTIAIGSGAGVLVLALALATVFVLVRRTDRGIRAQQTELRESEQRYAQLIAQARTVAWETDASGLFIYMSGGCREIYGYQPEELVGKRHFYDLHPEDGREQFRLQALSAFARRESFVGLENQVVRRDGGVVWVATNGIPMVGPDGVLRGYRGADTDITERKRAELAVVQSREQFELAVRGSSDGIWDWNLRNGSLYLSPRWKQQLGYDDDELQNSFDVFEGLVHPEDRDRVRDYVRHYLNGEIDHYAIEFRMMHSDGEPRWILARGAAVRDERGRPIRMAGSHTDITERIAAAQALVQAAEDRRILLDNVQTQIWYLTDEFTYGAVNEAHAAFFGCRQGDLAFRDMREALPEDIVAFCSLSNREVFQAGKPTRTEEWVTHASGERRLLSILKFPKLDADGRVEYVVCSADDITAQKNAEEELLAANRDLQAASAQAREMAARAEQASVAKSEFLANMSHEIRTPMNGVIGMTELLLDTDLDPDQQRYVQTVQESGRALLTLINDILDFSKIEARRLDLEHVAFDATGLLEDLAATMAVRAHQKGLDLAWTVDPAVPAHLRGDPTRLRQVLTNLLANAIKFTADGDVAVDVTLAEMDAGRATLRFAVSDTGIGIASDKIGQLFEKFSQVDASFTRRYGGTGLGLAISRELVALMGGEIGVTSEVGVGSEFWFAVSLEVQEDAPDDATAAIDALQGQRVLIVDDSAACRAALVARLAAWGMRPVAAADVNAAAQALNRAVDEHDMFRVLLVDQFVAGVDDGVLDRLISANPSLAGTPQIVLVPLGVRDSQPPSAQSAGCRVAKPVRRQDLLDALTAALGGERPDALEPGAARARGEIVPADRRGFAGGTARVLLVDDNVTNRLVGSSMLERLGLAADTADDGSQAIAALSRDAYDLVLMDIQMPEMDGFAATGVIRDPGSGVQNHAVPVIAMTAHAMQGDRERCLAAGMNDYLSKPIDPRKLARVLERWLPRSTQPAVAIRTVTAANPDQRTVPVFDHAGLLARLLGDRDLMRSVCELYLQEAPHQIARLRELMAADDQAASRRQVHTIKGAAANVGAERLRALAADLERSLGDGAVADAAARVDELEAAFSALRAAMSSDDEIPASSSVMNPDLVALTP